MSKVVPFKSKVRPPAKDSIFKKNMAALKKRYPGYVDLILNSKLDPDRYEIQKTDYEQFKNLFVKPLNMTLYDKANPIAGVANNMARYKFKNNLMLFILGFGLGYDPLFYTEQLSAKLHTEFVYVIEKDPGIINEAFKYTDFTAFFEQPRIELLIGEPEGTIFTKLESYIGAAGRYHDLRNFRIIHNFVGMLDNEDYYLTAMNFIKEAAVYSIMNYGNCAIDSITGVENMLNNLAEIVENPGINLLKDKFKGIPAVCIATGPSLNKNKHLLKGLQDKAVLISCDATLKILLEMDIKPHLVTTLEREMAIVGLFEGLDPAAVKDVYLMACPVVYNEVYQTYPGPNIIVYRNFDHFKWLEIDRGMIDIKFSSGNMNFKIAEYLGCDPIILIGQDLALTREGKTNATGATYGDAQESYLREQRFMLMGNDGAPIETTVSLKLFHQAYEIDVRHHLETNLGKVINATEGGAYIAGTEIMTFADAIKQYIQTETNPLGMIKDIVGDFKPPADTWRKLLKRVMKSKKDFKIMSKSCRAAVKYIKSVKSQIKELRKNPDEAKAIEITKKTMSYRDGFAEYLDTYQLYFAHVAQSYFLNFEVELRGMMNDCENPTEFQTEITLRHEEYFRIMGGLMRICIQDLEKAEIYILQRMKAIHDV
ncbi:MAG: 6-hydroxymethylpterin diphosphokinase MptE-like protein [Patescibacteria group bacterium]